MKCIKFNKNYLKVRNSNFFKGIYAIKKLEPKMFPLTILYGLISAIYPFVSIYGISIIIDDLILNEKSLYIHTVFFITINSVIYILNTVFHKCFYNSRKVLFLKQKMYFTDVLIDIKKTNYDSDELKKICNKEKSIIKHESNNPLFMICKLVYDFVSGFTNVILTFFIVAKLFFVYDNHLFITSRYFSIIVICITLIMIVLVGLVSAIVNKKTSKVNLKLIKSLNKFDYYWDYLNDFETGKSIRIFSGRNFIINSIKQTIEKKAFDLLDKKSGCLAKQGAVIAIIGSFLAFFVYLFIGLKCYIGLFSIGELTRYISGFMQIIQGGVLIANGIGQIIYLNNNLKYYFQLIDIYEKSKIKCQNKINRINEIKEIEFVNVCFKYENANDYIFQNLNLKISNNKKIAIVGENGSGKTTFIKLLLGVYKPTSGIILVNGVNLNTIINDDYLKNFSTMFQDYFLPGFTLNEIITGQDKIVCNEKILHASDCSGFLQNINLNENYLGTEYDVSGINFSGGEKQKIALARTLNKNCMFYIFDEPSSAMDAISEYNFYTRINEYLKQKSIIYISHRLCSCIYSDRILVFNNGNIFEDDSFDNLRMKRNSLFNELWQKQSNQYK